MKKVFLVTKMASTNLGNHALSMELIKLFEEKVGKENLYVDGRPLGLFAYSIQALKSSANPEKLFDSWADAVIKKYQANKPAVTFQSRVGAFKLVLNVVQETRFESIKAMLRPMKRMINRYALCNSSYIKRLAAIDSCDVFVYSGAGEIADYHIFLRQMLEIRIAQKLGKSTGAVNQSVVVKTPIFKRMVKHVYGKMDRIVVRGATSKSDLVDFGVAENIVTIAPDTAIKTNVAVEKKNPGTVGINFTPFVKYDWKNIEKIVAKVKQYNKKLVFVTNEPLGDIPTIQEFKKRFDVDAKEDSSGYTEYAKKLSQFDYVISTRLHTNILTLSTNTPIIPVEGFIFKTKELMQELEYPFTAVNVDEPGWDDELVRSIEKIESGQIDFSNYFNNILARRKQNVYKNVDWINNN